MSCRHKWVRCYQTHYERCEHCDTYHSLTAPPPEEIYTACYWDGVTHSTITDQVYNVDVHREGGLTKSEYVLKLIRTQDRSAAMDIGCAPGVLLRRLREDAGFAWTCGVEFDAAFDDAIRSNGHRDHLLFGGFPQATAELLDESFSVITALDVLEHSHEPQAFLAECARLLKPHGQLILMMPLVEERRAIMPRMFHPIEHVYLHSSRNLLEMLASAGFCGFRLGRWTVGHESVSAVRRAE